MRWEPSAVVGNAALHSRDPTPNYGRSEPARTHPSTIPRPTRAIRRRPIPALRFKRPHSPTTPVWRITLTATTAMCTEVRLSPPPPPPLPPPPLPPSLLLPSHHPTGLIRPARAPTRVWPLPPPTSLRPHHRLRQPSQHFCNELSPHQHHQHHHHHHPRSDRLASRPGHLRRHVLGRVRQLPNRMRRDACVRGWRVCGSHHPRHYHHHDRGRRVGV